MAKKQLPPAGVVSDGAASGEERAAIAALEACGWVLLEEANLEDARVNGRYTFAYEGRHALCLVRR